MPRYLDRQTDSDRRGNSLTHLAYSCKIILQFYFQDRMVCGHFFVGISSFASCYILPEDSIENACHS